MGVLSTSTAMDSILCSWHTTLSPEHRAHMSGMVGGKPPGWLSEGPSQCTEGACEHTLGQGELLKLSACFYLALSPT